MSTKHYYMSSSKRPLKEKIRNISPDGSERPWRPGPDRITWRFYLWQRTKWNHERRIEKRFNDWIEIEGRLSIRNKCKNNFRTNWIIRKVLPKTWSKWPHDHLRPVYLYHGSKGATWFKTRSGKLFFTFWFLSTLHCASNPATRGRCWSTSIVARSRLGGHFCRFWWPSQTELN